ncbi:MAG: helix-turn-helix domain-containing protein [Nocardioides sp.]|uniref:helix-turn-helix domain-containing protein n=1 Tax=Nocardioides sp. TaxID=35761 RepID=UPI0039E39BC8
MEQIEVSRNGRLSAVVGVVAGALALAFLVRLGGGLDLALGLVLLLIAAGQLWSAWDARVPLLLADEQGVRLRLGRDWIGLPWSGLEEVEHLPRTSWLRDGRLVLLPSDEDALVAGLEPGARRHARLTERLYGAPFVLPLGLTTRMTPAGGSLSARLADLSAGTTSIVEIDPSFGDGAPDGPSDSPSGSATDGPGDGVTGPAAESEMETTAERPRPLLTPERDTVTATVGANALALDAGEGSVRDELPEAGELRHAFDPFDGEWAGSASAVDEDGVPEEAEPVVPVIGPVLVSARENLGLSVDQLSQRTRIRSHVIASIERDDFAACGGDFYARGHLRTLARVLGMDVQPLLAEYDELYADAPIEPSRVFESDLTGLTGSTGGALRRSGPNWSVLVAAVMSVVLLWSVARLVFDGASPDPTPSIGLSSGSSGTSNPYGKLAAAVPVVLTAAGGGAEVVVRDAGGNVVYTGSLAFGESTTVQVSPPVRVQSSDGSLTVAVDGAKASAVGETGVEGQRIYAGPHD